MTCVEPRQTKGSRAQWCAQWGVLEPKPIPVQKRADSLSSDENVAFATASSRGLHDIIGRYQVRGVISDARKTCTLKATTRVHAAGPEGPATYRKAVRGLRSQGAVKACKTLSYILDQTWLRPL
jgi:hypothetical protein